MMLTLYIALHVKCTFNVVTVSTFDPFVIHYLATACRVVRGSCGPKRPGSMGQKIQVVCHGSQTELCEWWKTLLRLVYIDGRIKHCQRICSEFPALSIGIVSFMPLYDGLNLESMMRRGNNSHIVS